MAPVLCKIVGAQVTLSFEMYPLYTVGEVKQEITSRTNNADTEERQRFISVLVAHLGIQRWGIPADKMTLIRLSTVMEDSYCLLDYLISKLGDVRVEINDGCKGVEESNSEGYSTTT
ncbi:hypothetical protein OIU74_002024 [Salix koriyanagi]|uniref:Uncharacterized protein n=1 Tax=Salix koriyanagi TaxID=2511006 RepID=A0A9Q0X3L4_9ROSI|nr:hypothetical protein OIU74_002024 [Salix koriyanagi]